MPFEADKSLLSRVMMAESGGNPFAKSRVGAMGLMQLMPGTAKNPGFGVKGTDNPWNPQENMRVGRDYLNAMLNRYGGDEEAALIAYNAGPGNADKWVASGRNYNALPKRSETEPYVRKILGGGASPYLASALQAAGAAPGAVSPGAPMPAAIPAPPNSRYSKLADVLMASAAGAKPRGWGDLVNAAGDLALGYSLADKHDTAEKGYRSNLSEALVGAKDTDALVNTMLSSGDPDMQQSAVGMKVKQAEAEAAARRPLRGKDRVMALPNGQIFDFETMNVMPNIGPKEELTPDLREYAFSMKQRQEAGQPNISFDEWTKQSKASKEGGPKITDISAMRKEAASGTNVKKFDDAIGSYQSMLVSASSDNATSDLDMIYGLAKIMDPESVVREGEFETVRNSSSIPNQIKGYWEFLLKGKGKLDAATRQEILGIAANRLNAYRGEAVSGMDRYKAIAEKQGIDPSLIVREFPDVPQYKPPQQGTPDQIKDKYRQKYGIQP